MKKSLSMLLAIVLLCTSLFSLTSCKNTEHDYTPKENEVYVRMEVKGYGEIDLCLDRSAAPITVENFVSLVEDGFYDRLTFHRIIEGFMIQGGDPEGNGKGGTTPIKGEFSYNGVDNPIKHERGVISMARRGDSYDSGSCQFFIVHQTSLNNTYSLDGQYAAFGHVVKGMEVVDAIVADAQYNTYEDAAGGIVRKPPVIKYMIVLADGSK
ncbi:MAG: peptidylprolyl isomerase [Clostridia bacterium]|nr:peptidylprolyl isomerase [Clostridia bacterium]